MLSQDHYSFNRSLLQNYEDRFQKIMYPIEESTIPNNRNYLTTEDINGASPGTIGSKLK